jgi:hypothetical protein
MEGIRCDVSRTIQLKIWGSVEWIARPTIHEIAVKPGAKKGKSFLDGASRIRSEALLGCA